MNQPHTTAGTWFVTQYGANGKQLDFGDYLVEHNTSENPWETVDNYDNDYLDIGFKQQAERFTPVTIETWSEATGGDAKYLLHRRQMFSRQVLTRTKSRCGCNGDGRHIDPDSGMSRLCHLCEGRNWLWTGNA